MTVPRAIPRIAAGPKPEPRMIEAIRRGGGAPCEPGEPADALVWLAPGDIDGLVVALDTTPGVRWVQLPSAGVERFVAAGVLKDGLAWTCAKGCYAEPVAEHALLLALAGLRMLRRRITATSWGKPDGLSLYDRSVTIIGGGGIAQALIELLTPFRVRATVVRRERRPVSGAARVVPTAELHDVIPGALVVFVATALTPETMGIISAAELALMDPDAWLVNVARGRHVNTGDLVNALERNQIGGAALDVTDPEPLPAGHPLWGLPNSIITPHTADTEAMIAPLLAHRVEVNVRCFAAGEPLEGLVDLAAGY